LVGVLQDELAEGAVVGLASPEVEHGCEQQIGLLFRGWQGLQQRQQLRVAGHSQGEPFVQR
jgi:hypothetical protein